MSVNITLSNNDTKWFNRLFHSVFNFYPPKVVNVPSYVVRLDSQKHIDFSLKSPLGGGRPGRVKRKNAKKGPSGGGDDEE